MRVFRATVWTLLATSAAVYGDAGIRRGIFQHAAESAEDFEAGIRNYYVYDVNNKVWFGPITDKGARCL